jgi:exopolyphosphatase/guanosine-5'-triphosphate,3'-diphosphate pyrophosphatase
LQEAGVSPLHGDERMVGTGGTIRNLAKVDRRMRGDYPISRLHAYALDRRRLDGVASLLSGTPANNRAAIPGLNSDRSDSIVGGALVVQAVMDRLLAPELTVAGYGLREGVALKSVTDEVASIDQVQSVALGGLGDRFTAYDASRAALRANLARRIMAQLRPGVSAEVMLAAVAAARLLDIGASVDYYRRHAHSARIVCDANLDGFSHHTLALIAASINAVGERDATVKGYGPLLTSADQPTVEQIAAGVALSDALVRYGSVDPETISFERRNSHVVLGTSLVDAWPLEAPTRRAERAFGTSIERIGDSLGVA